MIHRDGRVRSNPDGSIDHWTGDGWVQAVTPAHTVHPAGTTPAGAADPNPFPTMEMASMPNLIRTEPVLVLLNGLAAVVNLFLVMLVSLGAVNLDGDQVAKIVAFVAAVCLLVSLVIRAAVVSPATHSAEISEVIDSTSVELVATPVIEVDAEAIAAEVAKALAARGG